MCGSDGHEVKEIWKNKIENITESLKNTVSMKNPFRYRGVTTILRQDCMIYSAGIMVCPAKGKSFRRWKSCTASSNQTLLASLGPVR